MSVTWGHHYQCVLLLERWSPTIKAMHVVHDACSGAYAVSSPRHPSTNRHGGRSTRQSHSMYITYATSRDMHSSGHVGLPPMSHSMTLSQPSANCPRVAKVAQHHHWTRWQLLSPVWWSPTMESVGGTFPTTTNPDHEVSCPTMDLPRPPVASILSSARDLPHPPMAGSTLLSHRELPGHTQEDARPHGVTRLL